MKSQKAFLQRLGGSWLSNVDFFNEKDSNITGEKRDSKWETITRFHSEREREREIERLRIYSRIEREIQTKNKIRAYDKNIASDIVPFPVIFPLTCLAILRPVRLPRVWIVQVIPPSSLK
jgi:hypothetical protein